MNAKDIKKVIVIGAGIMGEGIAHNFAQAGLSVRVVDLDKELLNRCLAQIETNLRTFLEFGMLAENPVSIKSRIEPVLSKDLAKATQDCDFVVEAIPEILEAKRELFTKLDSLPQDVILSSNTSSFTISTIAEGLHRPERVVGLHYFNPAHIIPVVEIHRGRHTSDQVVETTREFMLRVGKKPVLVRKEVPGFIVNRITGALMREIHYLLDEGIVIPEDLDTAIKEIYGIRFACFGPMEMEDMVGLDTASRASAKVLKTLSNRAEPSPLLLEKVNKGELGIKSGKGWYDYSGQSRVKIAEERNKKLLLALLAMREREKREK